MMQRLSHFLKRWTQPQSESLSSGWEPVPALPPRPNLPAHDGPLLRPMPSTDTQKMRIYKAMDMSG